MILLAVLLPIAVGILLPLARLEDRRLKLGAMLMTLAASVGACLVLALDEDKVFHILTMTDSLSLTLMTDDLSRLFIMITSGGWLLTGIYACVYMKHEQNEDRFFAFMLIS
jgi:multicomponent Na+:H+ antiporter subunit D